MRSDRPRLPELIAPDQPHVVDLGVPDHQQQKRDQLIEYPIQAGECVVEVIEIDQPDFGGMASVADQANGCYPCPRTWSGDFTSLEFWIKKFLLRD